MKIRFNGTGSIPEFPRPLQERVNFITHKFQGLRSFLSMPHRANQPWIFGDENHDSADAREFLLGPFFNLSILGSK